MQFFSTWSLEIIPASLKNGSTYEAAIWNGSPHIKFCITWRFFKFVMPYKIVSIKNKKQKTMISRKNTLFRYKGLCYAKIHMHRLILVKKKKKNRKYLLGDRSTQGQNALKNPRWPPSLCKSDEIWQFIFRHLVWSKVSTYRNMKSLGPITKKIQIIVDHHLKIGTGQLQPHPPIFQKKKKKKNEIFIPLEVYTYVVTACLILLATST